MSSAPHRPPVPAFVLAAGAIALAGVASLMACAARVAAAPGRATPSASAGAAPAGSARNAPPRGSQREPGRTPATAASAGVARDRSPLLSDAERARGLLWRFHAGAPVASAPALAEDGAVYVGTVDGYVHRLDEGGAFAWSFTVDGTIEGSPLVGPEGRIYLATTKKRVYALTPHGKRWWQFRSPVSVRSPVALGPRGELYFVGENMHLWALSSRAVALFRVWLGEIPSAGPVASPESGLVAVGGASGRVTVIDGARGRHDVDLGERIDAIVLAADRVYAVAGDDLVALDERGKKLWTRRDASQPFALPHGGVGVVRSGSIVFEITPAGVERRRARIDGRISAPPSADAAGYLYVPTVGGRLVIVAPDGVRGVLPVASAVLLEPVPDPARDRVIVAAGDGTVVAARRSGSAP